MTKKEVYTGIRAEIWLGDISIEVFLVVELEEYRLSQTQVLAAIEQDKSWFTKLRRDYLEAWKFLQRKGFTGLQLPVNFSETGSRGVKTAKTISIDDATLIWSWFARKSNDLAADILEACAAETIERRADAAFGRKRSEEEHEQRTSERLRTKKVRRMLTDAIQDYQKEHSEELSDNAKKWLYYQATEKLYRLLFGMNAKKLKELLANPNPRDAMSKDELYDVWQIEELAARIIDKNDVPPVEAVAQAFDRLMLEQRIITQ